MSPASIRDLDELHPKVKELAKQLIEACSKLGYAIGISETYRTSQRQDYLYSLGRTRSGNIVTYARGSDKSSYHQWRLAFDIYNNVPGDLYNETVLDKAGEIGESLGLEWGGRWSGFVDKSHFQYTFGLSIADLRAGKKPPEYTEDKELTSAVEKLAQKGVITSPKLWSNVKNIKLKYVPALLGKLGGIDKLVEAGVITNKELWANKKYRASHVRSLIIKAAGKM